MLKYFRSSLIVTILSLFIAFYIGGLEAFFITLMLAVLEVSLSFDNAIINAKEIEKMNQIWRKRFLTRWMIIAVFGMRIIFPVLIVSIVWDVSFFDAISIAINDAEKYQSLIESSHIVLSAFWWTFLFMVFISFFIDETKDIHRISFFEERLARRWKLESIEVVIVLLILLWITQLPQFPSADISSFLSAGTLGLITFLLISSLSAFLQDWGNKSLKLFSWWFWTFLYLEILDASFSFDGVIGAFALSKNILVIALGLGIWAMFVRSLTLMLVEKKTLSEFRYLEHGAFWAIGALALIMFASSMFHIPEIFTWIISWVLIVAAIIHSKMRKTNLSIKK